MMLETMSIPIHVHVLSNTRYVCEMCFLQGYFSGTSQYQFIAETYIVLILCILFYTSKLHKRLWQCLCVVRMPSRLVTSR